MNFKKMLESIFKEARAERAVVLSVVPEAHPSGNDTGYSTLSLIVTDRSEKIRKIASMVTNVLSEVEEDYYEESDRGQGKTALDPERES